MRGVLDQAYERLGPRRYVAVFYAGSAAMSIGLCALAVLAFERYRDVSASDLLAIGLVAEGGIALVTLLGVVVAQWSVAPAVRWLREGGTAQEAAEAWRKVTLFPVRFVAPQFVIAIVVAVAPVTAFCAARLDLGPAETYGLVVTMVIAGCYPTILYTFAFEVWLRPLVRDLAAGAGTATDVRSRVSLRVRLYLALPVIAMSTAFFAIVLRIPPELDRIGVEALAAVGIGAATSVPLVVLVSQVVLHPVREIVRGTRRVRAGDYTTPVPVLFSDELGVLARAFNDMTGSLQRAREQEVLAREEERRRLSHDLHDGLGPTLAAIGLRLQRAARRVEEDPVGVRAELEQLRDEAREAVGDVRRLVYGLRPPALDDVGLVGAIERAAASFADGEGAPVIHVRAGGPLPPLPAAVEVAALRIANEAMTNTVRHAGAGRCDVLLRCNGALELEIRDDGRGVGRGARPGVGTGSMRMRAEEVGGTFELHSDASGTRVIARLPVEAR